MSDRPIIFSADSVRAILAGRKTQTRRVIKPQPEKWVNQAGYTFFCNPDEIAFRGTLDGQPAEYHTKMRYRKGDRLWVRETWVEFVRGKKAIYGADQGHLEDSASWKSPIYMPRWASRITLEVTGVRVQRVQDISEDDCIAEGAKPVQYTSGMVNPLKPVEMFSCQWDFLNAKRGYPWSSNVWVWVVEFKLLQREQV